MRTSNELRQGFLDFFASKGHRVQPGISLVPTDETILLTSAGVVPFRHIIEGREQPTHRRVATCQRCVRVSGHQSDIENVGKFARYHTFFEMLGNFSFGDYYKRESLQWGWEFCTEVLGLSRDRFWGTIYPTDDEALQIWTKELGVPEERIIRLDDNFWGPVEVPGACGPDSEMYYDLGLEFGCGKPDCMPGCDCDRYLEFWNHVFTELLKTSGTPGTNADGTFEPLPQKNIDTGMGLERLTVIVQGAPSVYETDLFLPIMQRVDALIQDATGRPANAADYRRRVIADHSRAVAFMIMDGIYPSNESRGYVLRRLLRRASTFGRLLGIQRPFLHEVVPVVISVMQPGYPELPEKEPQILKILRREERQFDDTLDLGLTRLNTALQSAADKVVPGEVAFRLHSTFGFPLELTREIAEERGYRLDDEGYRRALDQDRDQARAAHHDKRSQGGDAIRLSASLPAEGHSQFRGYERTVDESLVIALFESGQRVEEAGVDQQVLVVLDQTPFYAESGGQIGDTGRLQGGGVAAQVLDTLRIDSAVVHHARVTQGVLRLGQRLTAEVDVERRHAIMRAHTATHLLHAALRQVLGTHVVQRGSVVAPDSLRFDFAHPEAVRPEQLLEIERRANEQILIDTSLVIEQKPIEEARGLGAMMLFGEKYGDVVRVVQVPGFSIELCGGTHVPSTGTIGQVKITTESSVASGVRRVHAVTGLGALNHAQSLETQLRRAADALEAPTDQVVERIEALKENLHALRRQMNELRRRGSGGLVDQLVAQAQSIEGVPLVAGEADTSDPETIKALADTISDRVQSGVVVLGGATNGKALFVTKVSADLIDRGVHAGNLVRELAKRAGGRGGGQAAFAQAGGDPSRIREALDAAPDLLREQLGKG